MDKLAVNIGEKFGSPFGVDGGKSIGDLVSGLLSTAYVVAGVIVLFMFVFGGVSIIAGAGKDNPEKAAKGKQALTSAAVGFVIIFTSFWVIRLIETLTGNTFLTNPGL